MPCTPDMVNHALAAGRLPGPEGTRTFLQTAQRDVHGADYFVVAENDLVVQFGSRQLSGRSVAGWPVRGLDAPAGSYRRDPAFACRMEAGRIAERRAIRDDLAVLMQLGALRLSG